MDTAANSLPPSDANLSFVPRASEASLGGAGSGPKYEQLRQQIIEKITTGRLKPGDTLPTERWWAESNNLARSTVRQAMALLERDGLICRVQGRGTFVDEHARERCRGGLAVFALVVPETQAGFYPSLQSGFDAAAAVVHHQLLVCSTGDNVDRQGNVILQLLDKQVAGVAIVPVTSPSTPAYQIRQLQKAAIPVVFCHRRVEGIHAPLLAIPFREVGQLVAKALTDHGHRRIGFVAMHRSASAMAHESALRAALAESRATIPEGCAYHGSEGDLYPADRESELTAALATILDRPDRPTALFASFDPVAELIYILLARFGLRVPQDISLIGFGGMSRTNALMRRLTSATIDEEQVGQQAATLLDQMRRGVLAINNNDSHAAHIGLSDGRTLGAAPEVVVPFRRSGLELTSH